MRLWWAWRSAWIAWSSPATRVVGPLKRDHHVSRHRAQHHHQVTLTCAVSKEWHQHRAGTTCPFVPFKLHHRTPTVRQRILSLHGMLGCLRGPYICVSEGRWICIHGGGRIRGAEVAPLAAVPTIQETPAVMLSPKTRLAWGLQGGK